MRVLATRIAEELKMAKHCAVYEPELTRLWPDEDTRHSEIACYAKSTVGEFGTTATDSAQSLMKTHFAQTRVTMKILARLIRRELTLQAGKYGHCAVYERELQRVWPITEENRKAKIQSTGRLVYYKPGLCAIFKEDSSKDGKGGGVKIPPTDRDLAARRTHA
jgi:hypothetical protein